MTFPESRYPSKMANALTFYPFVEQKIVQTGSDFAGAGVVTAREG